MFARIVSGPILSLAILISHASPSLAAPVRAGRPVNVRPPTSAPADRERDEVEPTAPPADAPRGAWPEQTPEERTAVEQELKTRVDGWNRQLRFRLNAYETKYFLFFTDIAQTEAHRWARQLDQMYARLAQLFAVENGKNIWRGKAVIIAFQNRHDFENLEKQVYKIDRPAGGRCHYERNGNVVITFYRFPSDADFARVLVHETTHGFFFRYRTGALIPSWVNEGLAEVMEYELVPAAGLKQASDAEARAHLRLGDALQGFFEDRINFSQYPVARTLTEFMIRQDKKRYVDFINAIKEGLPWQQALEQRYGVPLPRLVQAYGQSMGVPELKAVAP